MRVVDLHASEAVWLRRRMREYAQRTGLNIYVECEVLEDYGRGRARYRINYHGPLAHEYLLDSAMFEVHVNHPIRIDNLAPGIKDFSEEASNDSEGQ